MAQLPSQRQRWTPPAARLEGDRILKARAAQQRVSDAARQADAEAKVALAQEEKVIGEKVGDLEKAIETLTKDIPKILPASGGGRRTIKKILDKYYNLPDGLGSAAGSDVGDFATAAQGAKADTAVQPGDLATVATSGAYSDLSGTPTLGAVATSNDYGDLDNLPTLGTGAALDAPSNPDLSVDTDKLALRGNVKTYADSRTPANLVVDYGAVGDYDEGTLTGTDNTTAVNNAMASGRNIYVPEGLYLTTLSFIDLTANFYGPGTIVTVESGTKRRRGKTIYRADAPPAKVPSGNNITAGLDGDFYGQSTELYVSGATTAGDPAFTSDAEANYTFQPGIALNRTTIYTTSGKNASPFNTGGRTGQYFDSRQMSVAGKGDVFHFLINTQVTANDPNVLMLHGQPSVGVMGGATSAVADNVGLQLFEMQIFDNGYDAYGKGWTMDLSRSNDTAAKGQVWWGYRAQTTNVKAVDAGFQTVGLFKGGFDATGGTFSIDAFVAPAGAGITFDGVIGDIPGAPPWTASEVVAAGTYRQTTDKRIYKTTAGGTCGASKPTGTGTGISDGGVTWDFVVGHSLPSAVATSGGTKILKSGSALIFNVETFTALSLPNSNLGTIVTAAKFSASRPINSQQNFQINSVQVVGAQKTGWALDTGTAKRTANATYSGTAGAAYDQTIMQTLMNAVRDLSQTQKALKDDLHATAGHGLIGT